MHCRSSTRSSIHTPKRMLCFASVMWVAALVIVATPTIAAAQQRTATLPIYESPKHLGLIRNVWEIFNKNDGYFLNDVVIYNGTRQDALVAMTASGSATELYVDFGLENASSPLKKDLVEIPFALAGVAFAYNAPSLAVHLNLDVEDMGYVLRGQTGGGSAIADAVIAGAKLVLVKGHDGTYPWLEAILDGGRTASKLTNTLNVTVYDHNFIAAVVANPNVIWVDTEEQGMQYVKNNIGTIAMATLPTSIRYSLPVASISVPHPITGTTVRSFPMLDANTASVSFDIGTGRGSLSNPSAEVYPFVITAVMFVSKSHTCDSATGGKTWFSQLVNLFSSSMDEWHFATLPPFQKNAVINTAVQVACSTDFLVVQSKGSSAIQDLVTGLSMQNLINSKAEAATAAAAGNSEKKLEFIAYSGGGSGGGLTAIKTGSNVIVGSDSKFTEDEYTQHPTVQFVPVTSFAVSLAFNLPGVTTLVLPRCVVVGIFSGKITQWNHPDILRFNPTAELPKQHIRVWARESRSGTTGIFTAGLRALDTVCTNGNPTIEVSKTWDIQFPNLNLVKSTSNVLQGVKSTPYSIGYAGAGAVRALHLHEASLVDESTMSFTSSDDRFVQSGVAEATLHPERLELSFKETAGAGSYPFAGVSYLVYDGKSEGDCTKKRAALDFALWAVTSAEAQKYSSDNSFTPLPSTIVTQVDSKLREATCDGKWVIERPPEPADHTTTIVVAVVVPAVVLGILAILLLYLFGGDGKDNSYAPVNQSDYTILFTDIESSTSLWARGPLAMGPALDTHNDLIRACIKRNKCYEVKVIGDAFMIACKTPEMGVALALDIQRTLMAADWDADISAMYEEMYDEKGWATNKGHVSDEFWNGLRVRIGICTGEAAAKLDEISGGYDYFGSTVNMASRVEAAGHGGQIVISPTVLEYLKDKAWIESDACKAKLTTLGTVELKGFDDAVELHQILPKELEGRAFGDLRLDAVDKVNDTEDTTTSWTDESQASQMTFENSRASTMQQDMEHRFGDSGHELNPTLLGHSGLQVENLEKSRGHSSIGISGGDSEVASRHSGEAARGKGSAQAFTVGPDFIAALLQPIKEKEKREIVEKLCKGWRIHYKKKAPAELLENLTRRAIAVTREARKVAAVQRLGGSCASSVATAKTNRSIAHDSKSNGHSSGKYVK